MNLLTNRFAFLQSLRLCEAALWDCVRFLTLQQPLQRQTPAPLLQKSIAESAATAAAINFILYLSGNW